MEYQWNSENLSRP